MKIKSSNESRKMSNYRARMFEEHSHLIKNIEKLKSFIWSDKYDKLPEIERSALKEQLKHMIAYLDVLSRRVLRQCNNA